MKLAQAEVGQEQFGFSSAGLAQTQTGPRERFADEVDFAFPAERAVLGGPLHREARGIIDPDVAAIVASHARLVQLSRFSHPEGFMRPLVIKLLAPAVEAALLGPPVGRGRLRRLSFEGLVHALMRAILIRRGRLDELDLDA